MGNLEIAPNTPQRVAIVIEKNKGGNWSIGSYIVSADGQRRRHTLSVYDDYLQAAEALQATWDALAKSRTESADTFRVAHFGGSDRSAEHHHQK